MRNLDVWYTQFEIESLLPDLRARVDKEMRKRLDRVVARAFRRDSMQAYGKLAAKVEGEHRILSKPPLILRLDDFDEVVQRERLRSSLVSLMQQYSPTLQHDSRKLLEQFRLVDTGRKVVGVGSVGTAAWIALLVGRSGRDPLILQIKEAQPSVLEEFLAASEYENAGERVVAGQRIMQASSDIFLGWLSVDESIVGAARDYYVRQLRDWKGSAAIEAMNERGLTVYTQLCAATLAHAHARSGDRIAIASYLGSRRRLRPGAARLLRSLRRAERARLRRTRRRRPGRARGGGGRGLSNGLAATPAATVPACPSASASGRSSFWRSYSCSSSAPRVCRPRRGGSGRACAR